MMVNRTIALISIGFLMLTGCIKTRTQLREDASDAPLQAQTATQQKQASAKPLPTPSRFDEYDDQMRQFHGRIDSVENAVSQLNARQDSEKQSVTKMAEAIDQKFLAYEEEIKKLQAEVEELKASAAKGHLPKESSDSNNKTSAKKARTAFDDGEDLFNQKKWKEAIVAYQKYRDAYAKGRLYAEATYKIGVCFQELKMKDEARAFYDEVVAKYPSSREARKASLRMKSLK